VCVYLVVFVCRERDSLCICVRVLDQRSLLARSFRTVGVCMCGRVCVGGGERERTRWLTRGFLCECVCVRVNVCECVYKKVEFVSLSVRVPLPLILLFMCV